MMHDNGGINQYALYNACKCRFKK